MDLLAHFGSLEENTKNGRNYDDEKLYDVKSVKKFRKSEQEKNKNILGNRKVEINLKNNEIEQSKMKKLLFLFCLSLFAFHGVLELYSAYFSDSLLTFPAFMMYSV